MSTASVLAAALGSALGAAASSVLQHRSVQRAPGRADRGLRLLPYLLTRPGWLLGGLCAVAGLVLHAVALAGGRLVVVQPLLVSGLLFALPVSVLLERRRPGPREWLWAVVVVIGLAAFLIAARPSAGRSPAGDRELAAATVGCLAVVGVLAVLARFAGAPRAALLATGGGLAFGVASALLKQAAAVAGQGAVAVLTTWATYGFVIGGVIAVVLTQLAYRAGRLAESLPAMTISDPAGSVIIGALAFHERLRGGPTGVAVQLAAFLLMAVGARQVARHAPGPP
jgi:drug/metabolite transporter (DMT)-like permease